MKAGFFFSWLLIGANRAATGGGSQAARVIAAFKAKKPDLVSGEARKYSGEDAHKVSGQSSGVLQRRLGFLVIQKSLAQNLGWGKEEACKGSAEIIGLSELRVDLFHNEVSWIVSFGVIILCIAGAMRRRKKAQNHLISDEISKGRNFLQQKIWDSQGRNWNIIFGPLSCDTRAWLTKGQRRSNSCAGTPWSLCVN
ncbi:hypothetical protein U1Q18_024697 [Sarracenia purpurea var. burkii]